MLLGKLRKMHDTSVPPRLEVLGAVTCLQNCCHGMTSHDRYPTFPNSALRDPGNRISTDRGKLPTRHFARDENVIAREELRVRTHKMKDTELLCSGQAANMLAPFILRTMSYRALLNLPIPWP